MLLNNFCNAYGEIENLLPEPKLCSIFFFFFFRYSHLWSWGATYARRTWQPSNATLALISLLRLQHRISINTYWCNDTWYCLFWHQPITRHSYRKKLWHYWILKRLMNEVPSLLECQFLEPLQVPWNLMPQAHPDWKERNIKSSPWGFAMHSISSLLICSETNQISKRKLKTAEPSFKIDDLTPVQTSESWVTFCPGAPSSPGSPGTPASPDAPGSPWRNNIST